MLIKRDGNFEIIFNDGTSALFRPPTEQEVSMGIVRSFTDTFGNVDVLIANCLLEGDPKTLSQQTGYLTQIQRELPQMYNEQAALLEWEGETAIIEFADGKILKLKMADRQTASDVRLKIGTHGLQAFRLLINRCGIEGGDEVKNSTGHLAGMLGIFNEYISKTDARIKNLSRHPGASTK